MHQMKLVFLVCIVFAVVVPASTAYRAQIKRYTSTTCAGSPELTWELQMGACDTNNQTDPFKAAKVVCDSNSEDSIWMFTRYFDTTCTTAGSHSFETNSTACAIPIGESGIGYQVNCGWERDAASSTGANGCDMGSASHQSPNGIVALCLMFAFVQTIMNTST
jgi:hypothetical protein